MKNPSSSLPTRKSAKKLITEDPKPKPKNQPVLASLVFPTQCWRLACATFHSIVVRLQGSLVSLLVGLLLLPSELLLLHARQSMTAKKWGKQTVKKSEFPFTELFLLRRSPPHSWLTMLVGLSPLEPTNSKTHKCCCSNRCETNQNTKQLEKSRKEASYLVKQIRGVILLMLFFCNNSKCRHFPWRRRNKQTEEDSRQIQPAEEEGKKQARKRSRRTTQPSTQAKNQTWDLRCGREEAWIRIRVRVWRSWRCSCLFACYIAPLCFVSCDWQKRRDSTGVTLGWVHEF